MQKRTTMTTTTINERVQSIVDTCFGGNKRAFAKQIGVSATVIENVVGKRNGKPSFDVLHSICANANISAEWLLTGEGAMLKGEREPQPVSEPPTAEPEVVAVLRQQLAEKDKQIAALISAIGSLKPA